jgi:hypothetical protein
MRGIAHAGIEKTPYWSEDIGWWIQWRLLELSVLFLSFVGWVIVSIPFLMLVSYI